MHWKILTKQQIITVKAFYFDAVIWITAANWLHVPWFFVGYWVFSGNGNIQ